jgi:hypothetical protein
MTAISNVRYYEVRLVPAPVLNYCLWREMAGPDTPPPGPVQEGAREIAALDPSDVTALEDFARRAWRFVREQAAVGADPAREAAARQGVRDELPCLDDWTFETLWNVAYRYVMM